MLRQNETPTQVWVKRATLSQMSREGAGPKEGHECLLERKGGVNLGETPVLTHCSGGVEEMGRILFQECCFERENSLSPVSNSLSSVSNSVSLLWHANHRLRVLIRGTPREQTKLTEPSARNNAL